MTWEPKNKLVQDQVETSFTLNQTFLQCALNKLSLSLNPLFVKKKEKKNWPLLKSWCTQEYIRKLCAQVAWNHVVVVFVECAWPIKRMSHLTHSLHIVELKKKVLNMVMSYFTSIPFNFQFNLYKVVPLEVYSKLQ